MQMECNAAFFDHPPLAALLTTPSVQACASPRCYSNRRRMAPISAIIDAADPVGPNLVREPEIRLGGTDVGSSASSVKPIPAPDLCPPSPLELGGPMFRPPPRLTLFSCWNGAGLVLVLRWYFAGTVLVPVVPVLYQYKCCAGSVQVL